MIDYLGSRLDFYYVNPLFVRTEKGSLVSTDAIEAVYLSLERVGCRTINGTRTRGQS